MKKKTKKKSLLFYSIMLLSILSVGILATLFGPNVKNSVLSMFKNTEEKNSDGSPLRSKTIKDNGDGTYTIALNVTGESEPISVPDKKANVIIVMDTSGSMEDPADYSNANINSRTVASGNTVGRFCYNDNYYWRLYYRTGTNNSNYKYYPEGTGPDPTTRHQNVWYPDISNGQLNWVDWSGNNRTRYNFAINNNARIDETIVAVNNAIDTLLGQNTDKETEMVEIALISFGSNARYTSPTTVSGTWTSGKADGTAGTALKETVSTGLIPYGATNWDEALYYARQLAAQHDDGDDTYIIFFSDGEPTYYNGTSNGPTSHTHNNETHPGNNGGSRTDAEDYNTAYYEANQAHNSGYHLFGIFAYGSATGNGQTYMRTLTRYGNFGSASTSNAVDDVYYFSADNQEGINNAFSKIVSSIITNIGFSDVSISDGTTAAKTASSGQGAAGSLLKVDTNSYKYYLSFPLNENGTSNSQYITEITKVEGTDNDYQLKSSNGNTYTVTRVPAYITNSAGMVTTEEDTSVFKFEWKNNVDNPLHQENPPVATYNTTKNSVDWDLSTLNDKVLLNGVTYEVTFDCYPSQVTLDIMADVKNGTIKLDGTNTKHTVVADGTGYVLVDDYIRCNTETKECALKTNTDATLTYTDTRTDDGVQTAHYENPDPVPSTAIKSFAVSKEWVNFGSTDGESSISLNVDRDDSPRHYNVGLSNDNDWSDEIYASIGIMVVKDGKVEVKPGAEGHDYSFSEEQDISYKWELTSPTVRPMMINGVAKSLIKVDKPSGMGDAQVYEATPGEDTPDTYEVNSNGKNTYYKIGNSYYVVAKGTATLTATNTRRSYLIVQKDVTGADAPAGALFEFNMTVTEGKGEEVYFSIQDKDGNIIQNKTENPNSPVNYISGDGVYPEILTLDTSKDNKITIVQDYNELTNTIVYNYDTSTYTVYAPGTKTNGYWDYYTGYYYMDSSKTVTVLMEDDWKIRFTNLSSNSSYTLTETGKVYEVKTEGNTSSLNEISGFVFRSTESQRSTVWNGGDDTYTKVSEGSSATLKGSISEANYAYKEIFNNEYVKTHVDVEKIWEDNEDQDGKRPGSIDIVLKRNGSEYKRVTLDGKTSSVDEATGETVTDPNEKEAWKTTFEDLDVYSNVTTKEKYTYDVVEEYNFAEGEEDTSSYYTEDKSGSAEEGFTFTNTHTPETKKVKIAKVWEDADNQDDLRKEVTVALTADGKDTEHTITTNSNLTSDIITVDVYADGEEINYSAAEATVPTGYTASVSTTTETITDAETGETETVYVYTVTNTHTPATKKIKIVKVWSDNDDQDGLRKRGTEATIAVTEDGTASTSMTLTSGSDRTKNRFESEVYTVPVNKPGQHGEEVEYSAIEETTPTGYTQSGPVESTEEIKNDEGEVIDTITVYTITNTHETIPTEIKVTKVWDDEDDKEGFRPTSVTFNLYGVDKTTALSSITLSDKSDKDEAGNWTYTFTDLDKYDDGEVINYTVQEVETDVITGEDSTGTYDYEITGDKETGFVITNTHTPETRQIKVVKVWSDNNDQDGLRRNGNAVASITLYAGSKATNNVLTTNDTETIHEREEATYTVDKYADGQEIVYSVQENAIAGYKASEPVKTTEGNVTVFTITNTHTPETRSITITKVWVDEDNKEGFRPETIDIELTSQTESETEAKLERVITLDGEKDDIELDKWVATLTGLPKYRNGEEITYEVFESRDGNLAEDKGIYTISETGTMDGGFTITNTHRVVPTEVTVTKVWDDESNTEGFRPTSITLILHASDSDIEDQTATVTGSGDKWSYTFPNLLAYSNGQKVIYTVEEVKDNVITGKDSTGTYEILPIQGDQATGYTITNKHTPETTTSTVVKVWDDNSNQDKVRPKTSELTFQLKANGENVGEPITLNDNGNNQWSYTVDNLPKYADKKLIEYTWEEDESSLPEGYELTSKELSNDKLTYTMTNHRDTDKITISGKKVWDDSDNNDKIRPTEGIDVQLYANGTAVGEPKHIKYNDDNEWTFSFPDLEVNDAEGAITYTVDEVSVPEGYTKVTTETNPTGVGNKANGYTITNKHTKETTSVKVEKVWDDDNNRDAIQPESITIELYANGTDKVGSKVLDGVKDENGEYDSWKAEFTGLDKLLDGEEITYTVKEVQTGVINNNSKTGYAIKVDGDQEKGYTITNTHEIETTEIKVTKVWDDDDDRDVIRPNEVTVNIYQDGSKTAYRSETVTFEKNKSENTWYYTFTNLPKYKNVGGKKVEIVYSIDENKVTDYTGKVDNETYTITNTHTPVKTEISGYKVWKDSSNRDAKRPTTVTVKLYADDVFYDSKDVTGSKDEWEYTFNQLPKYKNDNGTRKEVKYTVEEVNVPEGYTSTIDEKDPFIIYNTYEAETTKVSGEKTWNDDDNREALRPTSIKVILMADGEEVDTQVVTENKDGKWLYSFDELPKYKNVEGKAKDIVYTISEETPEGYAPSYDIQGNVTNIENVHEIERITIDGVKDWDDEDDIEGFRPETITINLLADDEKIDSYEATAADGWKYSFEKLPKYKNVGGNKVEIKYTLTEESVDGYTADIKGYEVTNIHKVERVSFHITKVWDDDDNRDGIRPKSIVVTLNANGVAKQSVTLDGVKDDDEQEPWSYDFINLPKHSDGKVIKYTITEDVHEGYTSRITDIDENTTKVTITNTHTPERTEVSGTKTWEGDEDHLDQRPKYITVKLYANGELIDTIVVRAEDEWKYIVENLYKYKGGVPIKYTIEEEAVEGYITNYDGFNIINTRDSSGDVVPEELPPHTGVDYKYIYEFIITGLSGLVLLYRKEY